MLSIIDNCFGSFYFISCALHYYIDQAYVGSMSLQKLFRYHLPTRGLAGIKFGDVDTCQTYL